MKKNAKEKAVLVTTVHRGVFFGYLDGAESEKIVRITRARLCIYWDANVKGFMGLAATGPSSECRIGPEVPAITLQDVTSICEVAVAAIPAWEKAPWSK